jgi:preprotein translocase subunit SecF
MEFFNKVPNIDWMRWRKHALVLSLVLSIASLALVFGRGLNFAIDFTGGVLVEVGYDRPVELDEVRARLAAGGFTEPIVQHFGTVREVQIRLRPEAGAGTAEQTAVIANRVVDALAAEGAGVTLRKGEYVGPQVGKELTEQGFLAMVFALFGIMIYVWLRFEWKLAISSIVATAHDVIMVLGFFAVSQYTFDLTVFAAMLAIIGYSLNDTVVVFDRLRECFREMRKGTPEEIANAAINQTISRTIMTGVTTLLVLGGLFVFAGETLRPFSEALVLGVLIGTYSSIFVASGFALWPFGMWNGLSKIDLMPPKQEEVDEAP